MLTKKIAKTMFVLLIAAGVMTLGQSCNTNDVKDVLEVENDFIKANMKIESIDGDDINFTITVEAL